MPFFKGMFCFLLQVFDLVFDLFDFKMIKCDIKIICTNILLIHFFSEFDLNQHKWYMYM